MAGIPPPQPPQSPKQSGECSSSSSAAAANNNSSPQRHDDVPVLRSLLNSPPIRTTQSPTGTHQSRRRPPHIILSPPSSDDSINDNVRGPPTIMYTTDMPLLRSLLSESFIPVCSKVDYEKMYNFYERLKVNSQPELDKLSTFNIFDFNLVDCVGMLQTIAQQQQISVVYKVLPDTDNGPQMNRCSVQMGREPIIVCIGQGETPFLAQVNAARSALVHLKLILPEIQVRQ